MALQQQSPINLHDPIITDFGKSGLEIHLKKSAVGHVHKDEHGVQVVFGADERQFVKLNGRKYHLVQFHFHHPSEHWLNGKQQTMELHIVHQNIDDGTRVVLGIFIDATDEQVGIPEMVAQIKAAAADSTRQDCAPEPMNPLPFLPENTGDYYRYEGSLTTPEFDENVSWVVLKEPLLLPKSEVVGLIKIFKHPARQPQPLNRRFLLANFRP